MIFKNPYENDQRTDEELEEQLEDFRRQDWNKKEEWAMIKGALQTFIPAILLVCLAFVLVALLIVWILS